MAYVADDGTVLTDELLDQWAKEYEDGTWEGHLGEVTYGRPKLYDEDMETISFRLPESRIKAVEVVAAREGKTKSEFFREAIDQALLAAGA